MDYSNLNKAIEYIEENLDNEISFDKISKIVCMNEFIFQRIFFI